MNLRNFSAALAMLGLLTVTPGCKDFYDVNVDPLHPSVATEAQLLPGTQVAMATYLGFSLEGLGQATSTLVGQLNSGRGIGSFQQSGGSFSNQWGGLYNDMLENNEIIIRQASANGNKTFLGIAQLQKAYVFSEMVDMWGNIPYSQALQGIGNQKPRFDKDRDIYLGNQTLGIQGLFSLIDAGIANLTSPTGLPTTVGASANRVDLIYNGDPGKWVRFGNTLKLKLYNQIRLVATENNVDITAAVTPLLASPLMLTNEDFELPYNKSIQPENRNINYLSNYVNPGREDLINQDFYQFMINQRDPRMNYYFYNQQAAIAPGTVDTQIEKAGGINPDLKGVFATVKLGSSGPLASSASANFITLPGLYPSGGRYNDGAVPPTGTGADVRYARGLVAQRFLTKFARHFIEAELQLTVLNDVPAARRAYEAGIREAFKKVNAIGQAEGSPTAAGSVTSPAPIPVIDPDGNSAEVTGGVRPYINRALARFDAAANAPINSEKLNVIMQEKYVAGFGFGEDIYTDYRRTGYPNVKDASGLTTILPRFPGEAPNTVSSGFFPSILFYSTSDLTLNPNAPIQHSSGDKVFWNK